MQKQHLSFTLLALCFCLNAYADTWYISPKSGVSLADFNHVRTKGVNGFSSTEPHDKTFRDTALMLGASVGYQYTGWEFPLRGEVEYMYRTDYSYDANPALQDVTGTQIKAHLKNQSFLANGYIDFPIAKPLTIFLGGGMGITQNKTDGTYTFTTTSKHSKIDSGFGWMVTAGMSAQLTPTIAFDMSYRYTGLGDQTFKVNSAGNTFTNDNAYANEAVFAFRFTPFADTQS